MKRNRISNRKLALSSVFSAIQSWALLPALFGMLTLVLNSTAAIAQTPIGNSFTYQGRLQDGAKPADGVFDMEFRLHSSPDPLSSIQLGVETKSSVAVTNGLFTVLLDFGSGPFDGTERWLEIGVKEAGELAFTYLSPLQGLTATPYSQYSRRAGDAGTLGGQDASAFVLVETDPTVPASVKDGVDWSELTDIPAGFADGVDDTGVGGDSIPPGAIVMWSGSLISIPVGWELCDGTNGTPNLIDRFVLGVSSGEDPSAIGGSSSHGHSIGSAGAHNHGGITGDSLNNLDVVNGAGIQGVRQVHKHPISSDGGHVHSLGAVGHLPPYFKLAFIMKL